MAENLPGTNVGNNYIRIQDLIDALSRLMTGQTMSGYTWMYTTDVYDAIASLPFADVDPVVHGRWHHSECDKFKCGLCGYAFTVIQSADRMRYCPNCGAKMDGKRKE